MPFITSLAGIYGYGQPAPIPSVVSTASTPAYYTQNTGWLMNQPSFNSTILEVKALSSIATTTGVIKTYLGLISAWTFIHDKDLDSNVFYGMPEGSRILSRYTLGNGITTQSTLITYTGATTSVLGASYAPACMWTGTGYGAFVIGGFNQSVVHVLEFTAQKTIGTTYTVPYTSEVYGTEMVPKAVSGFNCNYGVAYTRGSKQMSSWTTNMDTRSWTNRTDNSYTGGTNGPNNGDGMIYYPAGKWITMNDAAATTHRIAMNDTSSARLYVWTITEGANRLNWTYLSTMTLAFGGQYPYHMSSNTFTAVTTSFAPTNITSLRTWLDADDATSYTLSGSNITQWNDKSGSGFNFSQGNAGLRPVASSNAINSRVAFSFTGGQRIDNSNITITQSNYSIFIVARANASQPSSTGYNYILKGNFSSDGFLFFGNNPSKFFATFTGPSSSWNDVNANSPNISVTSTTLLLGMTVATTVLTPYYSGNAMTTKTGTTGAFTGIRLGDTNTANAGQGWGGLIAEIVIYNKTLSTTERQQIEGYLSWKWGIQGNLPVSHPYKNFAP